MIADANFPATAVAEAKSKVRLIRMDGHSGPAVLEAILTLFPVDTYVPTPVSRPKTLHVFGPSPKRNGSFVFGFVLFLLINA